MNKYLWRFGLAFVCASTMVDPTHAKTMLAMGFIMMIVFWDDDKPST